MKHVALILIALAATGSAGAQTLPSGFRLVADVEDDRPARPAFGGWAWSTAQGLVLAGGDALWRVDPQGQKPPALLLRQAVPDHVQQLGGDLVAWGLGPDDERGLWLTDGSTVRLLGPGSFRRTGPVARQGDDFLVKQLSDTFGGELWRLGPGVEPVSLGAGGVFDTGFALLCGGVWAVPGGFLDCGVLDQEFGLRLSDGYGRQEDVGFGRRSTTSRLPLVPWVDEAGVARPGRVEASAIVPFDGLDLATTASSRTRFLGAREGVTPTLAGDLIVDCVRSDGQRALLARDVGADAEPRVLVEPRDWIPERLATDGRSIWRYTRDSREQIRRLSLSTGAWSTLVDLPAAVEEFPVFNPWDFIDAIVVDGASLWVTLPHPGFGREPWLLDVGPVFADGFESGDLRAWAQDTALSAEQLAR